MQSLKKTHAWAQMKVPLSMSLNVCVTNKGVVESVNQYRSCTATKYTPIQNTSET